MLYWTESDEDEDEDAYTSYHRTHSKDIETAGYALYTAVLRQEDVDALQIGKYLMKKRSARGGFYSTQVVFHIWIVEKMPTFSMVMHVQC